METVRGWHSGGDVERRGQIPGGGGKPMGRGDMSSHEGEVGVFGVGAIMEN